MTTWPTSFEAYNLTKDIDSEYVFDKLQFNDVELHRIREHISAIIRETIKLGRYSTEIFIIIPLSIVEELVLHGYQIRRYHLSQCSCEISWKTPKELEYQVDGAKYRAAESNTISSQPVERYQPPKHS